MRLIGIRKTYGEKKVLDGLSLNVVNGGITCVLGKSGVGKTTLLNAIAGICSYEGEVDGLPNQVGYVFQENRLISHMTVRDNLQYVGGRDALIDQLLRGCGLENLSERKAAKLSGGEKRRVSILRAFCVDSEVVLLDEPFSALDTVTKENIMALTHRLLKEQGKTAVLVTHDLDEALALADKIAVLAGGKIVYEATFAPSESPRGYGALPNEREELLEVLKKMY